MSNTYQVGDTAILKCTIYKSGALYSPDGGLTISVFRPNGYKDIDAVAMTEASTGVFTYAYSTTGKTTGKYAIYCISLDGGYYTRTDGEFILEP